MREVLTPLGHNLMVTPKEVDGYMKDMAHLLAQAINASLHDKVTIRNFVRTLVSRITLSQAAVIIKKFSAERFYFLLIAHTF